MDHAKFLAQMTLLAMSLPPRKSLEDAALEGYWLGLDGMSDEGLARAVKLALEECTFMPAPAELRKLLEKDVRMWNRAMGKSRYEDEIQETNRRIDRLMGRSSEGENLIAELADSKSMAKR